MTLAREELDHIDFSDIIKSEKINPVHPGEILLEEFLNPMSLSVYALAKQINIPRSRANDIVRGKRTITVDTALRLSRFFGTSAEFWLNLQSAYDLEQGRESLASKIEEEIEPYAA